MVTKDNNTMEHVARTFRVESKLYGGLTELAKVEKRSLNNMLNTVLSRYFVIHKENHTKTSEKINAASI